MRVCKGREKKALPNSGDVHNLTAHTYNVTNDQGEEGSKTIGVEHLLLSDFGNFADSLIAKYTMETLSCCPGRGFTISIAQVCSTRVPVGTKNCDGNSISLDGYTLVYGDCRWSILCWHILSFGVCVQ